MECKKNDLNLIELNTVFFFVIFFDMQIQIIAKNNL